MVACDRKPTPELGKFYRGKFKGDFVFVPAGFFVLGRSPVRIAVAVDDETKDVFLVTHPKTIVVNIDAVFEVNFLLILNFEVNQATALTLIFEGYFD